MTNGEKFQQIFAVSQVDECDLNVYAWLPIHDAIEIPLEWWNANYSEIPTGSTDCISRQAVIDLMMQKWGENFSGDDAMQESIDAIRVMPSVTPQEPKTGHWIDINGIYAECSNCNEEIYITGDFKYNQMRDSVALGLNIIDIGHYNTEIICCKIFDDFLKNAFGDKISVHISEENKNVAKFI
jgi:hypothetical protein